ncbi:MAG: AbiJ-NTD4 domain-containing protein [bacterium]
MKLFSHRKGLKPIKSVMQVDSIDNDLKNSLWNALEICYWKSVKGHDIDYFENKKIRELLIIIWIHYFKKTLDTLESYWPATYKVLKEYFFSCKWYEVYDFIEFVAETYPNEEFIKLCSVFLEREVSAYRFVDDQIVQITDEEEISEIEDALKIPIDPIREHIHRSLELFSDRKNPDYRNSIKESISAVETICRLIVKDDKATLGKALDKIEKEGKVELHSALKGAFSKIYGYTSDEDGIRHSLMDSDDLTLEDAKFMLVSCSAFINYLKVKSSKAGIKL